MNTGARWLIVDVETDGLSDPIHVVEIAAQLMEGWRPVGQPFRMLLNHDVIIPAAAVAVHGYTREYLRDNGHLPHEVYEAFRSYAQNYPLVAHNLSFDWNRCLEPEWSRLGIAQIGQRGFCSMMLARRLVWESGNYRLETLKTCFQLAESRSHHALDDVITLQHLFQQIYAPRLQGIGINSFDEVARFAKQTPVAKCLDAVKTSNKVQKPSAPEPKDEWYYLDGNRVPHGPFTASDVARVANAEAYYVWREGLADWQVNHSCEEFTHLSQTSSNKPQRLVDPSKTMPELIGVCRGIIADGKVTTAEVMFLNEWIQNFGPVDLWPASEISQLMEKILEDGVVTKEEKQQLKTLLERVTTNQREAPPIICKSSAPPVISPGFCVVHLEQGTSEWLQWRSCGIGASDAPVIMGENPWKTVDELIVEKLSPGTARDGNAAMGRGVALEPEARKRYIAKKCVEVAPACLQSNQHDWLRASVDGISADGQTVVEIKCGDSVYRRTAESCRPPDYYYGQLQHILAVTGGDSIDFLCYLPGRPELLVVVPRDEDYIRNLLQAEFRFWQKLQQMR